MKTPDKIMRYRKKHPDYTLKQLARRYKVSVPYVWKTLKDQYINPTSFKFAYPNYCKICSFEINNRSKLICSKECRDKYYYMDILCDVCLTPIKILKSKYWWKVGHGQRRFYHNRRCYYLGRQEKL